VPSRPTLSAQSAEVSLHHASCEASATSAGALKTTLTALCLTVSTLIPDDHPASFLHKLLPSLAS